MTSGIRRMFAFASTTLLLSLLFALPTARSGEKPSHPTVPAALAADGVYTSIDYPGAMMTVGRGINPEGEIAGWYFAADGSQHGYILQNGVFRTIDFPGASATTTDGGPNPKGDVVGNYADSNSVNHGYLLSRGVFTTIDFPGAAFTQVARYVNDRGDIVGWYVDPVGNSHGFVFTVAMIAKNLSTIW
jgi:hypothetical protein